MDVIKSSLTNEISASADQIKECDFPSTFTLYVYLIIDLSA
jgi:hypothetical protein